MVNIILELSSEDLSRMVKQESIVKKKTEKRNGNVLDINVHSRKVYVNKREIPLTKTEFDILVYLAAHPGRVFTYQQIYETVWEESYAYEKNNIMTHVSHLRAKIEPDPEHPQYIENVRGVGYRFAK